MPKKIEGLEDKILASARKIFLDEGFEAIDMRRIAKKAKIAVGTVYNYYPNKKELVYHLFIQLWNESFENLKKIIIDSSYGEDELIERYLEAFYDEMDKKNGLGQELMRLQILDNENMLKGNDGRDFFFLHHTDLIKALIIKVYDLSEIMVDKLEINTFAHSIEILVIGFSYNKEDKLNNYIQFIKKMIDAYVKQNC